jgi:hypothetical protein
MAQPELRLLAAAVALGQFTAAELAVAARSNPHTAASWLRRYTSLFGGDSVQGARGRPRRRYILTSEGLAQLRGQLDALRKETEKSSAPSNVSRLLDDVGKRFDTWRTIRDEGVIGPAPEFATLRLAIRDAWETFARMDALGHDVTSEDLKSLAEREFEAGIASPPPATELRHVAQWLADRLDRIIGTEASPSFASRVMSIRTEAHPSDAPRITTAAMCAAVWADENVVPVAHASMERCLDVARQVTVETRLRRAEWALLPSNLSPDEGDNNAQAIVRGLTACGDTRVVAVRDWLGAAPVRLGWRAALAPIVLHGLLWIEDCVLPKALDTFGKMAEDALLNYHGPTGRRRREAFDLAKRALQEQPLPEVAEGTLPDLSAIVGRFGSKMTAETPYPETATG